MEMVVCSGVALRLCRDKAWLPDGVITLKSEHSPDSIDKGVLNLFQCRSLHIKSNHKRQRDQEKQS